MLTGRFGIVQEAKSEFDWIKNSKLHRDEKLKELMELRNYLKETFLLHRENEDDNHTFREKLTILVNDIDKFWWKVFTKG